MQPNDCLGRKLAVFVIFLLVIVLGTIPAAAETKYDFKFIYNDSSGDYYSGYVYAPDGWLQTGSTISTQPADMGGAAMGGYYSITGVTTGQSASLSKNEYITSYYDGDTGKTSDTLYATTGYTTAGGHIYMSDRSTTDDSGYVYDPSVPASDSYFGSTDVCYAFSTSSDSNANFLVTYITDLRYWNQPSDYQNSCQEVASAEILAWWDSHGYSGAITTDWQNLWANDTANVASYESLLKNLGTIMGYDSTSGTSFYTWGSGLVTYMNNQGYTSDFSYTNYDVTSNRTSSFTAFKTALNAGRPAAIRMEWTAGGHAVVGRGYWNDGHVVVDMGWGSSSSNDKLNWYKTTYGSTDETAYITHFCDFHD
jgi:hypothetical protein